MKKIVKCMSKVLCVLLCVLMVSGYMLPVMLESAIEPVYETEEVSVGYGTSEAATDSALEEGEGRSATGNGLSAEAADNEFGIGTTDRPRASATGNGLLSAPELPNATVNGLVRVEFDLGPIGADETAPEVQFATANGLINEPPVPVDIPISEPIEIMHSGVCLDTGGGARQLSAGYSIALLRWKFMGWSAPDGELWDFEADVIPYDLEDKTFTLTAIWEETDYFMERGETQCDPVLIPSAAIIMAFRDRVNSGESFEGRFFRLTGNEYKERYHAERARLGLPEQWNFFHAYSIVANHVGAIIAWVPIGHSNAPFSGHLDGNGNHIQLGSIGRWGVGVPSSNEPIGLFGVMEGGSLKNLNVSVAGQTVGNLSVLTY